jgi:hypothetical protein
MLEGFLQSWLKSAFCKLYSRYYDLVLQNTTSICVQYCLVCFNNILFWHTDFEYGITHLPDLEIRLTISVTNQQGMLTPPRHLIPPLVFPIFRICISYGIYETDHYTFLKNAWKLLIDRKKVCVSVEQTEIDLCYVLVEAMLKVYLNMKLWTCSMHVLYVCWKEISRGRGVSSYILVYTDVLLQWAPFWPVKYINNGLQFSPICYING